VPTRDTSPFGGLPRIPRRGLGKEREKLVRQYWPSVYEDAQDWIDNTACVAIVASIVRSTLEYATDRATGSRRRGRDLDWIRDRHEVVAKLRAALDGHLPREDVPTPYSYRQRRGDLG
jgi:hypothetical protein